MAESSPPAPVQRKVVVRELSNNDVLCGRGPGLSHFQGNLRFREYIEKRKCRYLAAPKRKDKVEIAKEVYNLVHGAGGRFLKRENDETDDWYCVDYAVAMEKCKQALREQDSKTAKRSKRPNETGSSEASSTLSSLHSSPDGSTYAMDITPEVPLSNEASAAESLETPFPAAFSSFDTFQSTASGASEATPIDNDWSIYGNPISGDNVTLDAAAVPSSGATAFLSSPLWNAQNPETNTTSASSAPPPITDPRLLLLQNSSFAPQQQSMIAQSILRSQLENLLGDNNINGQTSLARGGINNNECREEILQALIESANVASAASQQQFVANNVMCSLVKNFALSQSSAQHRAVHMQPAENTIPPQVVQSSDITETDLKEDRKPTAVTSMAVVPEEERRLSETSIDEELSAFLLSSLAISDRPVVTEEQETLEMSMMSDAEKADVLYDVFGRMLDDGPPSKRQKLDLDKAFIVFLVNQMRIEIENISESKKCALMEAYASEKCSPDEFSDARLEKFLRCENMNVKTAAQRFVNYWNSRLDVFGVEKFMLPMKLSGALCEDLVAIQTGLYSLLPNPDLSGRPILFMEPRCHTRERYTSESMLRAIWYIVEVAAARNDDISGSVVNIVWFKNSTLLDYDVKVFDRWAYFMSSCWPVKLISNHLCCAPTTILQVAKPIVHSGASKEFRARTLAHAVPEEEILQVLWTYGIQSEMLPTQMGGAVALDIEDWISERRAAESDDAFYSLA